MAEDECLYDLDMLDLQLQALLSRYPSEELREDSRRFCSDYFELVKDYTSRWDVPLPQLRTIAKALHCFTQATSSLTSSCNHLLDTVSSLALSIYELLLFFDANQFDQEPLKNVIAAFQECYAPLTRLQNVHLQQVAQVIQTGGPWASASLQAILSESGLSDNKVDEYLSSELPVFFELRVRYLLSCKRINEALALSKSCVQHPATGQHLFFLQTYLTWLHKSSQHERLQKEVVNFSGKDAVHIICSLEFEETDETLLSLSRAFLSHQLKSTDMQYLCDLIFIWSKLHSRLNTPKEAFMEESLQLMSLSTNVHSIFPFIRALTTELGEHTTQFCVEICVKTLESCHHHDLFTNSLIYKTIACLLQHDLEVCRACALLVFFLERSVEAYKLVYVLYMHPDQEYHMDHNPIQNHIRFEMLQVLKKDLYFDPEFWNLFALQTNCLELMSEKLVGDALEEIMEEKWVTSYCHKLFPFGSRIMSRRNECKDAVENHQHKEAVKKTSRRLKSGQSQSRLTLEHTVRRRRRGRNSDKESSSEPLRRSFWQLDRRHGVGQRRTTRFSEKNTTKRRIRQPKWLLEDSGTLEENSVPFRGIKRQGMGLKRADSGQTRKTTDYKPQVESNLKAEQCEKKQKEFSLDSAKPFVEPQIILELSLPDNELPGHFPGEMCPSSRGHPQKLLCKQTLSASAEMQPVKAAHGKEVILRARDITMLVQLLHCYGRRPKGSGCGTNTAGSVSTITRSSVQASPPKGPSREMKSPATKSSKLTAKSLNGLEREIHSEEKIVAETSLPVKVYGVRRKKCEHGEEPAVEINVSIASQTGAMNKLPQHTTDDETSPSPNLNTVSQSLVIQDHKRPQSPCKGSPLTAGEVQLRPSTEGKVCTIKEQEENLSKVTHAPTADSKIDLELTDHKIQPRHQMSRSESIPTKLKVKNEFEATTSSSASEMPSNPVIIKEEAFDNDMEPIESTIESEESKLEFSCSACQKVFKGSRVVEHAMFHFRKDECMFCWTTFKDDLLAMMHMSDHIEKLKKAANKTPESSVAKTKSIATHKTTTKSRSSSTCRRTGMRRSSSMLHKPSRPADPNKSVMLQSKESLVKQSIHRLNGHTSNKNPQVRRKGMSKSKFKWLLRQRVKTEIPAENRSNNVSTENCKRFSGSHTDPQKKNPSLLKENKNLPVRIHNFGKEIKQEGAMFNEESQSALEKIHCPAAGCTWNTDNTNKRVALLYHALEKHCGDEKPLQLSFEIANGKCSICMRVLWSFEHFQHHVERHRLIPRHPCLHQGCTARFKTGMEMRRHSRMHNPLQARCCRPGCSKLFICLWALNLHEKEHYAVRSTKESRCNNGIAQTCAKKDQTSERQDVRASLGAPSAAPELDFEAASEAVIKKENESVHTNLLQNPSVTGHSASSDVTPTAALEKNLAASKTLKALSSFLLKHKPNLTKNSVPVSKRKQGRPRKHREEEPLPGDQLVSGQTKLKDQEKAFTDIGVPRKKGRPPKRKINVPDQSSGGGSTTEDVKEETDEIPVSRARLEDKINSPQIDHVQKRRGRPPKRRPQTNCIKVETGHKSITSTSKMCRKRGRPLRKKKETPNNVGNSSNKDQTPTMTTRLKRNWQQVGLKTKFHRSGQRGICLNVRKAGHDGFSISALQKRNKKLDHRVKDDHDSTKVLNMQEKSSHADQKEVLHKSSSKVSEEVTFGTNLDDKVNNQDADSKKTQVLKKCDDEVIQKMCPGQSLNKKPKVEKIKVEKKTTGKVKRQKLGDKTSQPKPITHQTKVRPLDGPSKETPESQGAISVSGCPGDVPTAPSSLNLKGGADLKTASEDKRPSEIPSILSKPKVKTSVCVSTLIAYAKKPYLRLPPTAYLDEKYTTMPRRKKDMLDSYMSQVDPLHEPVSAVPNQQRHRCGNCFAIFNSADELQEHRLKNCSNLFGFDSDEEGNG